MTVRSIVRIAEELCNGCGLCVTPCAEGAIELVGGKARVVREELCDGAGFCLAVCPTGALSIEMREAPAFEEAAKVHGHAQPAIIAQRCFRCDAGENRAVLIPCRSQGQSLWVCTRCLPALIHG
jgi:ferredoxin